MRTKPIIYRNKAALLQALPRGYATQANVPGDGPFGLVMAQDEVVRKGHIDKISRKLTPGCTLVIAAKDLTLEADELVKEIGGLAIILSGFGWTDKSHEEIRINVGAKS